MGIKRGIVKAIKSNFKFSQWLGLDQVKENGRTIRGLYQDIYSTEKKQSGPETFEQAMARFGLSEADLAKKKSVARRFAYGFFLGGCPIFVYSMYLLFTGSPLSAFASFALAFLLWAYAFRESFHLYQMKQRRLGCTLSQWFQGTFLGKNK